MTITRETDYAIRAIRALASDAGRIVKAADIAQQESIPVNFLFNILRKLKTAGIVDIRRGKYGGYQLLKSPSEITLRDMIELFEDGVHLNLCTIDPSLCQNARTCKVHEEFERIERQLLEELQRYSLAEILTGETE
nr:Rrf2 family transcriptional regulator [Maliibacterium massiliense]